MRFWRHNSPATLLLVILLPVLLIALATLQYRWLTEISRAERERLQARLQTDARRFAQDFNAEISKAHFIFQFDARTLEPGNANQFADRVDLWNARATFPNIVGEIYFTDKQNSLRFNPTIKSFENVEFPAEISSMRERLLAQKREGKTRYIYDTPLIDERGLSLAIPVFKTAADDSADRADKSNQVEILTRVFPDSFVIIKFNRAVIIGEMLPELIRKTFAADAESYDFSVADANEIIFRSSQSIASTAPDAATKIFDLSHELDNILFLKAGLPNLIDSERQSKIINQRIDRRDLPEAAAIEGGERQANPEDGRKFRIMRRSKTAETDTDKLPDNGLWLLSVRHKDGSLENFVGRTKWRNLGLSFGVLTLLGASVVLLLVSAKRSERAAQRQFDFVSSVSHEFRTPVAVIRSAGANLARGIVRNPVQIEKYGGVIERESNRIGEMVEQILEFAGARSNRQKYDFQTVAVAPLVEQLLEDSRSLLEENEFVVEKCLAPDLPAVRADAKALRQALENLVGNAIKYSNGSRQIKISAFAEAEHVAVSIEDKGLGIERRELKSIFEPFYRGRAAVAEQIRGNGLGLSLVKQIINAHDGKISVESEPGAGSKFTIKLPAKLNGKDAV